MVAIGDPLFFCPRKNADAVEGTVVAETEFSWVVRFNRGDKIAPKDAVDVENSGWKTIPADATERWTSKNKKRLVQALRETSDVTTLKQVADILLPGEAP